MVATVINWNTLAYDDSGSGNEAVLLIHGFPLSRTIWEAQVRVLKESHRVITPDVRGHGESDAPEGDYQMDALAQDIAGLMDHLEIEKAVIGGHSMGGYVALSFARQWPQRLKGLMLINTRAGADSPEAKTKRKETIAKVWQDGSRVVADGMKSVLFAPSSLEKNLKLVEKVFQIMKSTPPAGVVGVLQGMADREDSTSLLSTITVPALIITGAEDALIPPSEAQIMADAIGNSTLVTVQGAGHLASMEQPDVVSDAMKSWLADL